MKVKNRLSLEFTFLFAILLLTVLTGIYLFVEHNRLKNYFNALDQRAVTAAQFYLAEDNLSKENFHEVTKSFPKSLSREVIRIYDARYHSRFIPDTEPHWPKAILEQVTVQKHIHLIQKNQQVTGIYYVDNSGDYIIMVSAFDESGERDMHDLGLIMLFFFSFSLIITFVLGRIFSRIALSPIVRITDNLKKIRSSSLDQRLPIHQNNADEIDFLSVAINQLLEHLDQSFEGQQLFISNVSHELRTPLTTILGEAETTLMNERSAHEYKQAFLSIIKETGHLQDIISSLMELMQTSEKNFEFQPIRMDELLWEIVDDLILRSESSKIKVEYNLPTDVLKSTIQGNRELLFIAICNVIKNAVKFSDQEEVFCSIFSDSQGINLIIKDQGIGINQNDLLKVFQPFFRSSNAIRYPGYGIGLSLTQNVVRLHNGTIKVRSALNQGTEFQLVFPRSFHIK